METISTITRFLESEIRDRFENNYYKSERQVQEEFDLIWMETITKIRQVAPTNKYYIVESIQNPPSIIQYVSIPKSLKCKEMLRNMLHGKKNNHCGKSSINIQCVCSLAQNILHAVDSALTVPPNLKEEPQQSVSLNRFNRLLQVIQRIISDVYDSKDEDNASKIRKNVKQTLYGLGYEVLEYDETNDDLFDVRFEDCDTINIVSPTIRNRATGKIECKGIVYHPLKI